MGEQEGKMIYSLDGYDLKPMLKSALAWLRRHQDTINALNVFPVPDGDTGTNMTLTMTSAWEEISALEEKNVGRLMSKLAHGALMGARGNSGVILSQIWRGFARGLDSKLVLRADDLVDAMHAAAETAYKGVVKPVEGTILTVVREAAEETAVAAEETEDLLEILARVVKRAKEAEARTPMLLPVLRQAGVVDSGGQGLVVILEGMWRQLAGMPMEDQALPASAAGFEMVHEHPHPDYAHGDLQFDRNYPYDVQFIIVGQSMDVESIRMTIEAMGDCPLIVGDADAIKVHVHVLDPGVPISFGAKCGSVQDVVVEDMRTQYQAFVAERGEKEFQSGEPLPASALLVDEPPQTCVVVVAAGDGLGKVFTSLGATAIIEGGQTMNPSTAQILDAIAASSADKVIVLPNNKNILLAAQQAAEVSVKEVAVVPTRTIPQGIAALLAMDPTAEVEVNASTMLEAAKDVITGEVTWATRDVELNGIAVREGDAIGLLDGELVVDTRSFEEAVHWLLAEAELEERELVTLYYGEGVDGPQAEELAERLGSAYPDLEFEIIEGQQPHYPYIISIE